MASNRTQEPSEHDVEASDSEYQGRLSKAGVIERRATLPVWSGVNGPATQAQRHVPLTKAIRKAYRREVFGAFNAVKGRKLRRMMEEQHPLLVKWKYFAVGVLPRKIEAEFLSIVKHMRFSLASWRNLEHVHFVNHLLRKVWTEKKLCLVAVKKSSRGLLHEDLQRSSAGVSKACKALSNLRWKRKQKYLTGEWREDSDPKAISLNEDLRRHIETSDRAWEELRQGPPRGGWHFSHYMFVEEKKRPAALALLPAATSYVPPLAAGVNSTAAVGRRDIIPACPEIRTKGLSKSPPESISSTCGCLGITANPSTTTITPTTSTTTTTLISILISKTTSTTSTTTTTITTATTTATIVNYCDITYNGGGITPGDTVITPPGDLAGRDYCALCFSTPNCVAAATGLVYYQLLVRTAQLAGAPTNATCPLGIENYAYMPGPGLNLRWQGKRDRVEAWRLA
ncbi:hypothetical protein B0T14DRAFT_491961 [Immersiella caudata]|uniref:Uncharacterized protein n=1 Tax=Immersiella caudata TaxID=314043 RepID=A0AA39XH26_9PEZI|nr:hypothetical protein B0T14DRAFT_491961 [Immersiella caudata]